MSRGKSKKKLKLKMRRLKKKKRGINVPFSLANSPKKMKGIQYQHTLGTNIHNLIYVGAHFKKVKYSAANITNCNFNRSQLESIDFIGTNLKKTSFKNSIIKHTLFYNANLSRTNFSNAKFHNVYFINCKLKSVKNLETDNPNIQIINSNFEDILIPPNIEESVYKLMSISRLQKHYVLTTKNSKGRKINKAIIQIFLNHFTQNEIIRTLKVIENNKNSRYLITFGSYFEFFCHYLKKHDKI
ncbi:pentapeptide repeat-containing protein [Bacillus altitudinis]|uniref:pentapeptide repeat-containing protein n=1 Tax=Bacillus altitudinis TaxID=293387 RepID=UPI0022812725|nr:pentapeptide repeat-containing protein [Bacillus altitudinis]MCY7437593.1 pentapeptide repeat-containing protein [Bacillus altitudinis]MEC0967421.1 pentapeptide repeat-containing protein [Bacillus altitudinis]MEC1001323.1 pentapeptide repeat-containing protein [Bacillus altitudinis]MEC1142143.1 pentapeptide repeat-containing protein [Bacillus altitudinis]